MLDILLPPAGITLGGQALFNVQGDWHLRSQSPLQQAHWMKDHHSLIHKIQTENP
jgi:hypothetical protein